MYQLLIPCLTFVAVVSVGGALAAARAARAKPIEDRLRGTGDTLVVEDGGVVSRLAGYLGRLGKAASSGGVSRSLREEFALAGYYGDVAPMVYLGVKALLAMVGVVGMGLLVLPTQLTPMLKACIVLLGTGTLFFLPNVFLHACRIQRRNRIRAGLPDAIDLLEICVSAGMGLDMAWNVVAGEIRRVSPPLADEMALTNLEIHLGAPRVQAMRHLAERTAVEEISSLVAVLVQSERFGTSIAEALRAFSVSMRQIRASTIEEVAERMAVRLLFPMVLFVFPPIFVVTVGPAAITLIDIFSRS